jgi:multiple sugar transport system permease protein
MKKRWSSPYFFCMPMAFIMILLVYVPIVLTMYYSIINMDFSKPAGGTAFVGLANYAKIISDPGILTSLVNSVFVMFVVMAITVIFGLIFSLILNVNTPIKGVLTAISIIPWALPGIVSGIVWRWMFHPSFGFVNSVALHLGLISQPIQWLSNRWYVLSIVSIAVSWKAIPIAAITFLAALQGIPSHLYESAEIDGCSWFNRFTRITLPLLRPAMGIVFTTTSITALNVFDEVVTLTGYSNVNSTLLMDVYLRTFRFLHFSQGSALVWLVMLFTAIIGFFYVKKVYNKVEYL